MNVLNNFFVWLWWTLTIACVVWYSTITVYVAFKGVFDIRGMLKRLAGGQEEEKPLEAPENIPNL